MKLIEDSLVYIGQEDDGPKKYFGQSLYVSDYRNIHLRDRLENVDLKSKFNTFHSIDGAAPLIFEFGVYDNNSGNPRIATRTRSNDRYKRLNSAGQEEEIYEFYYGDWHLISNTPKTMFRANLSIDGGFIGYFPNENTFNKPPTDTFAMCRLSEQTPNEILQVQRATEEVPIYDFISNQEISPFEFYIGFTRVSEAYRPEWMNAYNVNVELPNIKNVKSSDFSSIDKTSTCYSWIRIYDGSNIGDIISNHNIDPGHFICTIKVCVNMTKLTKCLQRFTAGYLSGPEAGVLNGTLKFAALFNPVSIYSVPNDIVEYLVDPLTAIFNTNINQIIFKSPRSYKSSGNIQYILAMRDVNGKMIFAHSTMHHLSYGKLDKFTPGWWSYSDDNGKIYPAPIRGIPEFDNMYSTRAGIDEDGKHVITYTLSNDLKLLLEKYGEINITIHTFDGTQNNTSNDFNAIFG